VRTLTDVPASRGRHTVAWDGRDEAGGQVASGVYYVKGAAGTETDRTTLVILR
jgi:flagellar hook assembly protein FlgD